MQIDMDPFTTNVDHDHWRICRGGGGSTAPSKISALLISIALWPVTFYWNYCYNLMFAVVNSYHFVYLIIMGL